MSTTTADPRSIPELREAGCTCEFGCMTCGMAYTQMGNCPSFHGCPVGRAEAALCPVHDGSDAA